jgi:aspartate racemase
VVVGTGASARGVGETARFGIDSEPEPGPGFRGCFGVTYRRVMQHIGIVACSAEGASLCFETICRLGLQAVGKNDHPRITMDAIPLARWMPAFEAGDHGAIGRIMVESATVLAKAGADFAICPDNSAHLAWSHVQERSPIPWLHIVEELAAETVRRGHRRVGVLGTRFTMAGRLYTDVLEPLGIEVVVPDGDDFETVDRIIFDELIDGVFTPDSRDAYAAVIDRLAERGCDAVALACTEIPLLVDENDSSLPILDSTRLLAAAALRRAI